MSPENAARNSAVLHSQLRLYRLLCFVLSLVLLGGVVILGFVLLRETIRIVPPEIRRPYEIGANYANKDYLAEMSAYVLSSVLTVTPDTVDYNTKVILKMTHPDGYATLKTALEASAARLKRERITTIWSLRSEVVDERNLTLKASGSLKTYIADKLVSESPKDYFVKFLVTTSGRLYVTKIEEIVKSEAAAGIVG